jgi:hypothetical protein
MVAHQDDIAGGSADWSPRARQADRNPHGMPADNTFRSQLRVARHQRRNHRQIARDAPLLRHWRRPAKKEMTADFTRLGMDDLLRAMALLFSTFLSARLLRKFRAICCHAFRLRWACRRPRRLESSSLSPRSVAVAQFRRCPFVSRRFAISRRSASASEEPGVRRMKSAPRLVRPAAIDIG